MTDTPHIPGCTGKRVFASMKAALRRAKLMRRKYHEPLEAYRCPKCHGYHIGGGT